MIKKQLNIKRKSILLIAFVFFGFSQIASAQNLIIRGQVKSEAGELIEDTIVIPDKFAPNSVCFTVDRTDIFSDNFVITVDSDCDTEGLEIKSTTEIIPNDIDTGNKVQIVDHSIPVPVGAATIELSSATVTNTTSTMFSAKVTELGDVGNVNQWAEYGVFWSTDFNTLNSDNFTELLSNPSNNYRSIVSTDLNKYQIPTFFKFKETGLTSRTRYYYKAFIRTNTNTDYNTGNETIAFTKTGFRQTN